MKRICPKCGSKKYYAIMGHALICDDCGYTRQRAYEVESEINEALENIHDLIMNGRYKEACELFEKWFHEYIGT